MFGYFPGNKIGFAGNEAQYVIRDWAHQSRTGRYELKNSRKNYEELLGKVNKPVLAISIHGDTLAPPSAVEHLCGKLKQSRITHWHYIPDKNLKLLVNHFTWVKQPEAIVTQISNWTKNI
jgi:predicted alpha/beta hydrolase